MHRLHQDLSVHRIYLSIAAIFLAGFALVGCISKVPRSCKTTDDCRVAAPAIFCQQGICTETQCQAGQQESCYQGPPETLGQGICQGGTRTCLPNARWSACLGQQLPQRELCDKIDNDCDGRIDNVDGESCQCFPSGQKRACYTGSTNTEGKGSCKGGVQYCERDSTWGRCLDAISPQPEICNGFDDDCNGLIDDHPSCTCENGQRRSCYPGDPAWQNKGRCQAGIQICQNHQWSDCSGFVLPRPEGEDCSTPNIDDNCDGQINEGCDGSQTCSPTQTRCGRVCVDLQTHAQHCGQCDRICSHHRQCRFGSCVCPAGLTSCFADQPCVNTQTDTKHCGACSRSCINGETCCAGNCVDIQKHAQHCGACQRICPAGYVCQQGACSLECGTGLSRCADLCVDLKTQHNHCGTCGTSCRSGEVCVQGACQCPEGTQLCENSCVDFQNDTAHCGACKQSCASDQYCQKGICSCQPGLTRCAGMCVNLNQHANHCGQCGLSCGSGQFCNQGKCESCSGDSVTCGTSCCPKTLTCCDNKACVDLQKDPQYCGTCNLVCTGNKACNRQGTSPVCQCREGTITRFFSGPRGTLNQGVCRERIMLCKNGQEIEVQSERTASQEQCNGLDDDCDGKIDEVEDMLIPPCAKQLGVCANSKHRTCLGDKGWLPCSDADYLAHHASYQVRETDCDGLDNDCDGQVDESQDLKKIPCIRQSGVCQGKFQRCVAGKSLDCDTPEYRAQEFGCNNIDDNCDGSVDEGLNCGCLPSALVGTFTAHSASTVVDLVFHPTEAKIATLSGTEVRVWDMSVRKTVLVIALPTQNDPSREGTRLAWSPDGSLLAVATRSKTAGVWLFHAISGQYLRNFVFQSPQSTKPDETQPLVTFSPDGRYLLTGTGNLSSAFSSTVTHPLILWEVHTGLQVQTYTGHDKGVLEMAFDPTGQFFVSCGYDKKVVVWNTKTAAQTQVFTDAKDIVRTVDWSRDGKTIAGGLANGQILLWQEPSPGNWKSRTFDAHLQSVGRVRFRPNSQILASMSDVDPSFSPSTDDDRATRLWDVNTGSLQRTLYAHFKAIKTLAWRADGFMLATSSVQDSQVTDSADVKLWACPTTCNLSAQSPVELGQIGVRHTGPISALAFHPDGLQLASGSEDGSVSVWSIPNQNRLYTHSFLPTNSPPVAVSLTFSPLAFFATDVFLIAALNNSTYHLWTTKFAQNTGVITIESMRSVAFCPRRYEWFGAIVADNLGMWKANSIASPPSVPGGAKAISNATFRALAWSADGTLLATGDSVGTLSLWSIDFAKNTASINFQRGYVMPANNVSLIRWHPSGEILVAGPHGTKNTEVSAKSIIPGQPDPNVSLQHNDTITDAGFSPDGAWLATVGSDKLVKLYSVQKSGAFWQIQFRNSLSVAEVPTKMAWSPTGRLLVVGLKNGTMLLYSCPL